MRLIDADALIAELQKDEERFDKEAEDAKDDPSYTEGYSDAMWSRANGIRDAIVEVYDAPSIDIVRCGECKYWHKNRKEGDGMNVFDVCYDFQVDDFCSYGERKESE